MPQAYQSSADIDAMIIQVTPAVLTLLGDGRPHRRREIVDALAGQYPKDDVVRTLMRLTVTGQLAEAQRKYRLARPSKLDQGSL